MKRSCLLQLALTVSITLMAMSALALDLYVPGNGSNVPPHYNTIAAAIGAANTSDIVHLTTATTYAEPIQCAKSITIVGDVPNVTVSRASYVNGTGAVVIQNVRLLTTDAGAAMTIYDSASLSMTNCVLTSAVADGISFAGTGPLTLDTCQVNGNAWVGIRVQGTATQATLTNSQVNSNGQMGIGIWKAGFILSATGTQLSTNVMDGIYIEQPATVNLSGCTLNSNGFSGVREQADAAGATTLVADNCQITNNGTNGTSGSAHTSGLAFFRKTNFTLTNSTISGSKAFGIIVGWNSASSTGTLTNVTISNSGNDGYNNDDPAGFKHTMVWDRVTVRGNAGEAVWVNSQFAPANAWTANRCLFEDGTSNATDLLYVRGTTTSFTNCIMNEGTDLVHAEGFPVSMLYCTLVSRSGLSTNGFHNVWDDGANLHSVVNCIISGPQHALNGSNGKTAITNHNNLLNGSVDAYGAIVAGASNVTQVSPQFVLAPTGPGTGDLHLQSTSPAIGLADASAGILVDYEAYARPMPVSSRPDAGAYEEAASAPTRVNDWSLMDN